MTSAAMSSAAILVVDDSAETLFLIEKTLTTSDRAWEVVTCNSGEEAIKVSSTQWFDLVLLDLEMPSMSGLAVARQLRARETRGGPRIIIVALTAQTSSVHQANAFDAGFDGFLTKPFRRAELLEAIDRYLRAG
jgi:CheY-like chemotaxis protein